MTNCRNKDLLHSDEETDKTFLILPDGTFLLAERLLVSERSWRQSTEAVLVGLQELAAGRERAVKAGGEAGHVCGDVGEDTWGGLVVVGDLK